MNFTPTKQQFEANSSNNQLIYTKLSADNITPVGIIDTLKDQYKYCFLFESVVGGESRGRYSIIGIGYHKIWQAGGQNKPLDDLRKFIADNYIKPTADLPPMASGVFGYMGYDCVRFIEDIPQTNSDDLNVPDSIFIAPKMLLIFDTVKDELFVIAPTYKGQDYDKQVELLQGILQRIGNAKNTNFVELSDLSPIKLDVTSNYTKSEFCNIVEQAKEYIRAGDIFQIVPSQRFTAKFNNHPFSFYRALRYLNPSPYLFYLQLDGTHLVGSSPEVLVKLEDNKVTIRPLAGTRKRGTTRAEDEVIAKELLVDKKELAEHLMLLDLGRNDVGRVAAGGQVNVTEQMVVEYYSHVMHISSNVEGELDSKYDVIDALMAGFPAGTVSGAPKIRAMQIINELENTKRKFYAGMVGYFNGLHQMNNCIALRTALIKDNKINIQAGAGVVADSDPEAEYNETVNKAAALIKAAEISGQFEGSL